MTPAGAFRAGPPDKEAVMRTVRWAILLFLFAALVAPAPAAQAQGATPGTCAEGFLETTPPALTKLCRPEPGWNGDVLIYAHGYVAPGEPLHNYELQLWLPDGTYLPDMVQRLGFALPRRATAATDLSSSTGWPTSGCSLTRSTPRGRTRNGSSSLACPRVA
jgi:hypothetical protein